MICLFFLCANFSLKVALGISNLFVGVLLPKSLTESVVKASPLMASTTSLRQ